MVDYVEYPVDTLVKIVVPKKKDDGGGGGPDGGDGSCGSIFWLDSLQWVPGFYVLHPNGLYAMVAGMATGDHTGWSVFLEPLYISELAPDGSHYINQHVPYLWSSPNQFIVTADTTKYASDPGITGGIVWEGGFSLKVFRNRNPQTFNPCNEGPDQEVIGSGVATVSLTVDAKNGSETFPPIIMDTRPGDCRQSGTFLGVQAICENQFEGLPPTPPTWVGFPMYGIYLGPALAGSWFISGGVGGGG